MTDKDNLHIFIGKNPLEGPSYLPELRLTMVAWVADNNKLNTTQLVD